MEDSATIKRYRSLRDTEDYEVVQEYINKGIINVLSEVVKSEEYAQLRRYLRNEISSQATRDMMKDGKVDEDEKRILDFLESTKILDTYAATLLEHDIMDVLYLGILKIILEDRLETSEEARAKEYLRRVFGIPKDRADVLEDRFVMQQLLEDG